MHPLETRDVAAASIIRECSDRGKGVHTAARRGVWLDTPMIEQIGGEGTIEKRIPAMLRMFVNYDIDMRKEPILVYPDAALPERRSGDRRRRLDAERRQPAMWPVRRSAASTDATV